MNAPKAFDSTDDIGHYVGGNVVSPKDGRFADVYNPTKGTVARKVALASRKDVDAVVAVAQKAFESWSQTSPLRRARILFKYLELLNAHRDELAAIITAEQPTNAKWTSRGRGYDGSSERGRLFDREDS